MRFPNLRYGNPAELRYHAQGRALPDLSRQLRRDERTVRDWLSGASKVPFWVPELVRLQRLEGLGMVASMGAYRLMGAPDLPVPDEPVFEDVQLGERVFAFTVRAIEQPVAVIAEAARITTAEAARRLRLIRAGLRRDRQLLRERAAAALIPRAPRWQRRPGGWPSDQAPGDAAALLAALAPWREGSRTRARDGPISRAWPDSIAWPR